MDPVDFKRVRGWIGIIVGGAVICIVVLMLAFAGIAAFSRYQERQQKNQDRTQAVKDANNKVRVSTWNRPARGGIACSARTGR